MKLFIAVCLLFSLAMAEDYRVKSYEDLLQYRSECVKELNIPDSSVEQYKKWVYPNDAVTHCYLKCVFIRFGLFDVQSGFHEENIYKQLVGGNTEKDSLHSVIKGCVDKNEQGSNACEWAYRGATCFFKKNLKLVQKSVAPAN